MADRECYIPNQLLDLDEIQQEAKHRWLRPNEICEILSNHHKFELRSSPPCRPPAGSLFLFDRKIIRYFRRDGHYWRKKNNGKAVKEAHEKLKSGSVDVLHCYYAHGEDNENFQRRCYWMLDERFEHIVLVHYREVKEGHKSGSLLRTSQSSLSPEQTGQMSYASDPNSVEWNEQSVSSRLNEGHTSLTNGAPLANESTGYFGYTGLGFEPDPDLSNWTGFHGSVGDTNTADLLSYNPTDSGLSADGLFQDFLIPDSQVAVPVHAGPVANSENFTVKDDGPGGLRKLDSFGRWMDQEMGGDCEDSLMASDYWNTLAPETYHMHLNTDSVGPSLAQEQLFSIFDFAPDWAYSGSQTKVLITGTFLGDKKRLNDVKWCCMFGEIEVPAERLTDTVIRCNVPFHAAGRVPFYITCSNRLACSEVREFEYVSRLADKASEEEECGLLVRLSKLLSLGIRREWLGCSVENCEKCKVKDVIRSLESDKEKSWRRVTEVFKGKCMELLIQNLLKDKLYEWLISQVHEERQGLRTFDEKGQGVIHLAAALGYDWALGPIVAAGLSPNFRDANGRTALHWASLYGREETVVALVKLGTSPGAVDDPTSLNPGGQTAADLASSKGHKGIAGYLAEADLTSHIAAFPIKEENVVDHLSLDDFATDDERSMRRSLEAVCRSEHAAALIQGSLRVLSFRQRQGTASLEESREEIDRIALGSLHKVRKTSGYEDYLHFAASTIQQNYRGWKGRNEFTKLRNRIVKIQAHFRGHQVRKRYKKVVWSVGVVEKAILRWRRKSRGLQGFRPEFTLPSLEAEAEAEYDYLSIGRRQKHRGVEKALARVHSMARHAESRDQYTRLMSTYQKVDP